MSSGARRPGNGPCRTAVTAKSLMPGDPFCGANPVHSVIRMVTTFSEIEKTVLKRSTLMKFTFTHPMHSHPYNPELVTDSGSPITLHPHNGGSSQVDTTRWTHSWPWDSRLHGRRRCG